MPVPTADLANVLLPENFDAMPKRELLAWMGAEGLHPVSPRQSADAIRDTVFKALESAKREARFEAEQAQREASRARRASLHEAADAALVDTRLPRRAMSDAASVLSRAVHPFGDRADDREVRLQLSLAKLVAVVRAAADPASGVTLEDALREAEEAEYCAKREAASAKREAVDTARALRDIARSLDEEGR